MKSPDSPVRIMLSAHADEIGLLVTRITESVRIQAIERGGITARALDDRIGVFIVMEALRRAKEKGCSAGVYAAATVGEETTKNGAYWASTRIQPTLAVVVDMYLFRECL